MSARRRVDFTPSGKPVTHGRRTAYVAYGCRCDECTAENTRVQKVQNAARAKRDLADIPHGLGGYVNYGCRCGVCHAAQSNENRRQHLSRLQRQDQAPHGTVSGYTGWGCRCERCRAAASEYRQARDRKSVGGGSV